MAYIRERSSKRAYVSVYILSFVCLAYYYINDDTRTRITCWLDIKIPNENNDVWFFFPCFDFVNVEKNFTFARIIWLLLHTANFLIAKLVRLWFFLHSLRFSVNLIFEIRGMKSFKSLDPNFGLMFMRLQGSKCFLQCFQVRFVVAEMLTRLLRQMKHKNPLWTFMFEF